MSFFLKWKLLQYFGHWNVSSVTGGGGGASAKFRSSIKSITIHLVRLYRAAKQVLDLELLFVWLDLRCRAPTGKLLSYRKPKISNNSINIVRKSTFPP